MATRNHPWDIWACTRNQQNHEMLSNESEDLGIAHWLLGAQQIFCEGSPLCDEWRTRTLSAWAGSWTPLRIVRGYIVIGSLFLLFIEFKIELPRADTLRQVATRVRQRNAHLNQLQILYIGTHYLVVIVLYNDKWGVDLQKSPQKGGRLCRGIQYPKSIKLDDQDFIENI